MSEGQHHCHSGMLRHVEQERKQKVGADISYKYSLIY